MSALQALTLQLSVEASGSCMCRLLAVPVPRLQLPSVAGELLTPGAILLHFRGRR